METHRSKFVTLHETNLAEEDPQIAAYRWPPAAERIQFLRHQGGREVGQQVSHYIEDVGPFAHDCAELVSTGFDALCRAVE